MKISVKLINQYLQRPLKTQQMAEYLEKTEVEVEEILYANQLDEKIIVAEIKEVSSHPNADKLKLAKVMTDAGEISLVCGAPNIRVGMKAALAQIGTVLPSGDIIGEASIRGEKSHGMLCSALELGWSEDHSGLIELDPALPIGKSLCDIVENSDILDIKTPSNRWDYLSYIGLAREIAAILSDNGLVEPKLEEISYSDREVVKVNSKELCSVFVYAKLSINTNTESPKWLVDNLQASGMRSINPVVDITNFVMLEMGQPSHAYDAKKIKGTVGVRLAKAGESFTTLDGKDIKLTSNDLVIVDKSGPIALAGVMGGISTETTKDTKEIILEVANFDKTAVRRSALRHGLRTEASSRFERGLPLPLPHFAANRIIALLEDICGAKPTSPPTHQIYASTPAKYLGMRIRKAERFLGYKLDEKEVNQILSKRGFKPYHFSLTKELRMISDNTAKQETEDFVEKIYSKAGIELPKEHADRIGSGMAVPKAAYKPGDVIYYSSVGSANTETAMVVGSNKAIGYKQGRKSELSISKLAKSAKFNVLRYVDSFNHIIGVEIPWWRLDISAEVDLFEEVAKSIGYANMPSTVPSLTASSTEKHQLLPHLLDLKKALASYGLVEVVTYSFVSQKDLDTSLSDSKLNLEIENPLSSEQAYLRSNMMASQLRAVAKNLEAQQNAIFEVSRVYEKMGKAIEEQWQLAMTVWGKDSLLRLKGALDMLFDYYRLSPSFRRDMNSKIYHSGRSALIGSDFGKYGQIKDSILRGFDISKEVSYAEINIQAVINAKQAAKILEPLPYQMVSRDITIEVDHLTTYEQLASPLDATTDKVGYVGEYSDEKLTSQSRKRITLSVEFNLGPNPKAKEIENQLQKCSAILHKIPQAKVL